MIPRCKTTIWTTGKEIVEQTVAKIEQSWQNMQALSLADSPRLGVQDQIKNKWKHIHEKSDAKEWLIWSVEKVKHEANRTKV